jgi:hypothetical protein
MARRWLVLFALLVVTAIALPVHAGPKVGVVRKVGRAVGGAAGFGVTVGLAASPKWNRPMRAADGKTVTIRAHGHPYTLKARHAAVLGPKISARAATLSEESAPARVLKRFVTGVGEGATVAPPAEGRFEASAIGRWKNLTGKRPATR